MVKFINRNRIFVAIIAILAIFCISIGLITVNNNIVNASEEENFTDEIVIAHITDTHYYPLKFCYTGEGGEFADYMQETNTKMWLESQKAFEEAIKGIKNMAPDYVVLTGDVAQDGERESHVEVANELRKLQNELRITNPDFQIFVIMGNHDLYNPAVYDFSGDGMKKLSENISRKDVTKIYASLGYPDITDQEAENYYSEDEYTDFSNSTTAAGFEIKYQYTYRENDSDYDPGELTYIATTNDGNTFIGLDIVESNIKEGHVLGATLTDASKTFLTNNTTNSSNYIGLAHHSIIPHWKYHEEITTGFIVNNWVDSADFLADYGMRYVFTGHVHSNDIVNHISFDNNQIIDIGTSANLSVASNVRYATIENGTLGEKEIQNFYSQGIYLKEIDFTDLIEDGYISQEYLDINHLNEFMDGNICTDFSSYAKRRIYDNAVEMKLKSYLTPSITSMLSDKVKDILPEGLSSLGSKVDIIVQNLISEIETKVLSDYEYSGNNQMYNNQNKLFGFLEELVYRCIDIEVSEDTSIVDLFMYAYMSYNVGNEADTFDELPDNIKQGLENIKKGSFIEELFDTLLDEDNGLYFLVNGIMNTTFDLSEGVGMQTLISIVGEAFLGYDEETPLTLDEFLLNDVIAHFLNSDIAAQMGIDISLKGMTVMGYLDESIEGYMTKSMYEGYGNMVYDIISAFCVDDSFDGNATKTIIKIDDTDVYTYISTPRADNPTIENGKIPSMVTANYGENPASSMNFVWFTDKRVEDSYIQYMKKSNGNFNENSAIEVEGECDIYYYTRSLIDLGILAQLKIDKIGRHTVELDSLDPNTEYWYRLGSKEYGYYSEIGSFKTAPGDDSTPFEVLMIADLQGFVNSSYENIGKVLENVNNVFDDGYDFVINVGDVVDNSKNMNQFSYFLNTLRKYWMNTTQVVAIGNHGNTYFEMDENITVEEGIIGNNYNNVLFHYNFSIPENQDTSTGAYYSFDYSGVHFTVLNTNDIENDQLGTQQMDWLKKDLKNTTKKYKVVIMHKSIYSCGSHSFDSDVIGLRNQLTGVFSEYGVHIVFGGHDHTYTETYYLDKNGDSIKTAPNGNYKVGEKGTFYITLGTLGNKYYNYKDNENVDVFTGEDMNDPCLQNPTFGKLVFDGKNLYYQGYQYDYENGEISEIVSPLNMTEIILIVVGSIVVAAIIAIIIIFIIMKKKKNKPAKITQNEAKAEEKNTKENIEDNLQDKQQEKQVEDTEKIISKE